MSEAILLVAHGSRSKLGQAEIEELADKVAGADHRRRVGLGYLELCDPPAPTTLDRLVEAGAHRVAVVPLMLLAAGHSKSDVPAVVLEARARHPGVEFIYGRPLGTDHSLVALAASRIEEAGAAGLPLALLTRGTSDPDANAEACKIARLVADSTGAALAVAGFAGVAQPSVPEALEQLGRLGAARIVVFSWFLATGVLLGRIQSEAGEFAERTGIDVIDGGHLGPDSQLVDLVLARADEAFANQVHVNCDTCVYRKPFPGFEDRVGLQVGIGHSHLAVSHRHGAAHIA